MEPRLNKRYFCAKKLTVRRSHNITHNLLKNDFHSVTFTLQICCVSASCLHGTNLTSEWLTRQLSSGELVFTLASRRNAATMNTLP